MNGVPMRRVNQAYVIATSMSVDVSKVEIPAVDDSYFAREETAKKTDEDQFFEQGAKVRQEKYPQVVRRKSHHGSDGSSAFSCKYEFLQLTTLKLANRCWCMWPKLQTIRPSLRYHRPDGALRREGVVCEALTLSPLRVLLLPCPASLCTVLWQSSTVSDKRKADQKTVDAGVLAAMTNPMLKAYLNAKFSLKKGDRPHEMVF